MTASGTPRRTVLAAGLAALFGGSLAGCGTSGPKSGDSAGGDAATVWILSGVTEQAFRNSFTSWNDHHPDQRFTVQAFANDPYKQKIRTAVGAGQAPTLIYGWGGGTLASYVRAHKVEDLSDLVADTRVQSRFMRSVAANGEVDGTTYAVPNNGIKPVMFYYNRDLYAKIGAEPAKSWNELLAQVAEFKRAKIAPITVAGQAKWPLLPWFSYLIDRIGGPEVLDAILAGKDRAWSHPAVTEANVKIQALVDAGGFVDDFASITTDSGGDVALMYTGKAAMTLGLPAAYQTTKQGDPTFVSEGKLGYFPFPTVEGGTGDPLDVVGNPSNYWSISSSASDEQKEAARAYLTKDLLNAAYVDDLLNEGNVPPVADIGEKIAKSSDPDYFTAVYEMTAKAGNFALSLDQALSPKAGDAVLTSLQQVFLKQITPKEFADTMNATLRS